MKLIYKTALPVILMIVVMMVGIFYLSRYSLEHTLIIQDFERVRAVSQNALELETGDEHLEGEEESLEALPRTQILEARDFLAPSSAVSRIQFRRYLQEFKDPIVIELNIFDREGRILASNQEGKTGGEIRTEGVSVFDRGEFYIISRQNGENKMVTYVPFIFGTARLGAIEITSDLSHILIPIREEMNVLTIFLLMIGFAAALIFYLTQRLFILKPIYYLRDQAQKISEGKFDTPIKTNSFDELGVLAVFFDRMRENIKISFEKLAQFNEELSQKVEERTLELQKAQAKLMASIESLKFGFVLFDEQKNILLSNSAARHIVAATNNQIDFYFVKDYFGAAFDFDHVYQTTIEHKESYVSSEINIEGKFLKVMMEPVITETVSIGVMAILEDVTDEVLLQRRKEEFFAVASHELRTPLTSIRGNLGLIKDYYQDKIQIPEVINMVMQAHQSAVGLLKIVNDFLDAAKLERGGGVGELKRIDLVKVVSEVINELSVLAKNKGIVLTLEPVTDRVPEVLGEELRLREVAYNLIGNGLNYTEKGEVKVKVFVEGERVKVQVTDTGIGISPQNQKLLFQKFQQAGENIMSRPISTSSTGMGLYISKLLVEAMQGEIGLLSSSPLGSVFFFSIPIAKK